MCAKSFDALFLYSFQTKERSRVRCGTGPFAYKGSPRENPGRLLLSNEWKARGRVRGRAGPGAESSPWGCARPCSVYVCRNESFHRERKRAKAIEKERD